MNLILQFAASLRAFRALDVQQVDVLAQSLQLRGEPFERDCGLFAVAFCHNTDQRNEGSIATQVDGERNRARRV